MGKMKADPRYNIISLRICNDDFMLLDRISRIHETSVSDIMREALRSLIKSVRENPELAGISRELLDGVPAIRMNGPSTSPPSEGQ